VHDEDLDRNLDRVEDPVEVRDDRRSLVVRGDNEGDARRHTRTPRPTMFQMSTMGLLVSRSRYGAWGAAITSTSDRSITSSIGSRSSSHETYGSVQRTSAALKLRMRLSL